MHTQMQHSTCSFLLLCVSNDNGVRKAGSQIPLQCEQRVARERARCEIDYPNCIVRRKTVLSRFSAPCSAAALHLSIAPIVPLPLARGKRKNLKNERVCV